MKLIMENWKRFLSEQEQEMQPFQKAITNDLKENFYKVMAIYIQDNQNIPEFKSVAPSEVIEIEVGPSEKAGRFFVSVFLKEPLAGEAAYNTGRKAFEWYMQNYMNYETAGKRRKYFNAQQLSVSPSMNADRRRVEAKKFGKTERFEHMFTIQIMESISIM